MAKEIEKHMNLEADATKVTFMTMLPIRQTLHM